MAQGDITIRIKTGGTGTGGTLIDSETGKVKSQNATIPETNAKNIINFSVAKNSLDYAKTIIIESAEYAIYRNFQLTDDYIGKRNVNIALNMINRGIQLGQSVATGFLVGGPVGAVVSGVGNIAVQGIGVFKSLDQQNIKIAQLDEQLSYTRERVGYSLTDGSVGRNL